MSVITTKDIVNEFNSTIARFISDGYIISPFTANGSYHGTKMHTDMINPNDPNHILRIWLLDLYHRVNNKCYVHIDVSGVRVNKYKFDGDISKEQTLWPNEGETVYEKLFYMFKEGRNHGKCWRKIYTDSLDEAIEYLNVRDKRLTNCFRTSDQVKLIPVNKLPPTFIDSVMNKINSTRGCKRATASCITSVAFGKNSYGKLMATVKYSFNNKQGYFDFK